MKNFPFGFARMIFALKMEYTVKIAFSLVSMALGLASLTGCTGPTPMEKAVESQQHYFARHVNGSQPVAFHQVIVALPPGAEIGRLHSGAFRLTVKKIYW
ncbi:MAG TPA: hypothetical protein VFY06_11745, partial [Verrucomicrobiae bacterium]|nr:hypothetical protein [Verrucomicrobiae bacterium]